MSILRRGFFGRLLAGGVIAGTAEAARQPANTPAPAEPPIPTETPDLPKLPFRLVNGVKEFHLHAEVVRKEIAPGRWLTAWGYNGEVPGPMIEVTEGDRVRIMFHNHLPEMTAIHWHGLELPMEIDGSLGVGESPIMPGGMRTYEFTLQQNGTFFYHSHFPMQEMIGMIGFFVVHPKVAHTPKVDRDFGLILQEWMLLPNTEVPNTLAMEFNWLTFNGKSGPDCTPMIVKQGERVRIRLVNLGMDHHPVHLHGNQFCVTGTEAGRKPETTWFNENTLILGVAQSRDIEFTAKHVGDWMLHCHLPHHMMNQMVPMVGPMGHGGTHYPQNDPEKKKVPGYPQDMWMPNDASVPGKPENAGLRADWTGAMGGMMTLVRVLPPDKFEEIEKMRKSGQRPAPAKAPAGHEHHHQHDGGA